MVNKFGSYLPSLVLFLGAITASAQTSLVPAGAVCKYLDNGSSPTDLDNGSLPPGWTTRDFLEVGWGSGDAELGYNTDNREPAEVTKVSYGPNSSSKYITTYFRHLFIVADPLLFYAMKLRLQRDDGTVVYLNGEVVHRTNMPEGAVSSTTLALAAVGGADESTFFPTELSNGLVTGTNVLAVEIPQHLANSKDISFNLELLRLTSWPQVQPRIMSELKST